MRKADIAADELRSEYRREDFGPMVRGKYATRLRESSNIVVLDPEIAEAFPNAQAVNAALRGLLELAKTSARLPVQSPQRPHRQCVRSGIWPCWLGPVMGLNRRFQPTAHRARS